MVTTQFGSVVPRRASAATVDGLLRKAADVLRQPERPEIEALDDCPLPIYATDADGRLTYYNPACIEFAGRTPSVSKDRWCVTWRLYSEDGEFLPHDECPMATAIQRRRPVRGVAAIAERPDGSRRNFLPFPTPLFSEDGAFAGAVNLFLDVTVEKRIEHLREQAARCRQWAGWVGDAKTVERLVQMAVEFDAEAQALESDENQGLDD